MESLVGERLGRFHIERLIGKGGMGEVYAAVDESLDREVAIKVLGSAVDDDAQRRRFMREARLAAKLTHPNIASVFEVGESDGRYYIVMELLEGESLRKLLSSRRLSVEEALTIGRDVARALARAHAADVIHRDVKPENIFVTRPSSNELFAKVLDFGLARHIMRRPPTDEEITAVDLTGPGEACGTAGYLSPEQARGFVVDVRADIFSFGAVMYEMLAGKRAFDGQSTLERMLAVVKSVPEPLRVCAPDVPPELEAIVERCLAKAPADRYANGEELLAELETLARGSRRMPAVDPSSRSLVVVPDTGREGAAPAQVVAPPSSARAVAAVQDSGPSKAVSTVTPAPAVRSGPRGRTWGPGRPLWPWLTAGGCAFVGLVLVVITIATRPTPKPRPVASASSASEATSSQIVAASAPESTSTPRDEPAPSEGAEESAPSKETRADDEQASTDEPSKPRPAPAARAKPRPRPTAVATATAATTAPPGAAAPATTARSTTAASSTAAAPTVVAAPYPTTPPQQPRYGTVRIPPSQASVMVVVVDGEYRRVKDAMVVVPCGRRKIRVGLLEERVVDVPCGGTINL